MQFEYLCHVLHEVNAQQCSPSEQKREASILGMMLQGNIFKRITEATLDNECLRECYLDVNASATTFKIYACADHICKAWYNGSYIIMMAKPKKSLELHVIL